MWQVVRASTAAPSFFDSQKITIAEKQGHNTVQGELVDGGVSPYNNPSLQALMYATLDGYNIGWPTGADKIQLLSVGTGKADSNVKQSGMAAKHAIKALSSLMDDCATMQETLLQWMSSSPTAKTIDRELGWAEDIGFNTVRVYLHDLLWEADPEGFTKRIKQYLQIAEGHKIKTLFVIFDDC